jgi:putative (di)nucleoside polyphosphate hydrolase
MKDDTLYRPCVGIALLNQHNQVFVGKRVDTTVEAWQMPQGGIDAREEPHHAVMRELLEEVGTNKAFIIEEYPHWLYYDLPPDLQTLLWGGAFLGQRQRWFALNFTGTDSDIAIHTSHPEFIEWRWTDIDSLPALIVPFKRPLYTVLAQWLHTVL